ncbi:uncharacterized protein BCR38DRAFT_489784 [Pseudomassariella vexata]|uniref:Uncharacterized protein n=1 Tax=Pseudomassariella vexata TaxID=1141098 RepID=A0A1Y2DES2_9PEZI|nr:uncharacterized protein BCR38DRAFT_489784 [Pseudomassariella vexata]ORY57783.1 hypothetical protein BCR38DRAFT_489784 [Pseudomassariella vexata]
MDNSRPLSRTSRHSSTPMPFESPPLGGHLSIAKHRSSKSCSDAPVRLPPWSRDVDVTFHKDPLVMRIAERSRQNLEASVNTKAAEHLLKKQRKVRREFGNVESLTYAAIISILNYKERRGEPEDEPFRKVIGGLYLLHGLQEPMGPKNESHDLFDLPERVRRRIWSYVVLDGQKKPRKPVRLQPFNAFLKDVWLSDDFYTTRDLFQPIRGALSACSAMRVDLMAYILATHRFHFTFSPYVRDKTCPEFFHWMYRYSHLMQLMIIELDLSRLEFGADAAAIGLSEGSPHVDKLVAEFVEIQLDGRSMPIQSLVLLARRFHGQRTNMIKPDSENGSPAKPRAYCSPNAELAAARPLVQLAGQINTLRIAGFSRPTTDKLLAWLFPTIEYNVDNPDLWNHCHRTDICTIWPFLPGQASVHRDTQFGAVQPTEPCLEVESENTVITTTSAKRQIAKLMELLQANEEKQQRRREANGKRRQQRESGESNDTMEEGRGIIQASSGSWTTRGARAYSRNSSFEGGPKHPGGIPRASIDSKQSSRIHSRNVSTEEHKRIGSVFQGGIESSPSSRIHSRQNSGGQRQFSESSGIQTRDFAEEHRRARNISRASDRTQSTSHTHSRNVSGGDENKRLSKASARSTASTQSAQSAYSTPSADSALGLDMTVQKRSRSRSLGTKRSFRNLLRRSSRSRETSLEPEYVPDFDFVIPKAYQSGPI